MLRAARRLAIFALAATPAAFALGASGTAPSRSNLQAAAGKYQQWQTAAAVLAARPDARSLATAAALRYAASAGAAKAGATGPSTGATPPAGPSAVELAVRAADLAPQDAGIGWLRLQLCAATPSCDVRDAATVMRWVDADNGAAWLQTLAAAQKDRDATEIERILSDMAQGARFDFYSIRIVVLMADALGAARGRRPGGFPGSEAAKLSTLSAIAGAEIYPPFTALVEACRESSVIPERRELCLKLSKTMQRGDTIAAQLAGLSIEKRLHSPDSREVRTILERRRVLEWRVAAAAKADDALLPWTRNARARARLRHMRALPREEDVCIAILREHRMALEPPEVRP